MPERHGMGTSLWRVLRRKIVRAGFTFVILGLRCDAAHSSSQKNVSRRPIRRPGNARFSFSIMSDWYQLERKVVLEQLATDQASGLSEQEAARRLAQHGRNELVETGARSPWRILWEQLTARMVLVLIAAAIVSALLADYKDAIAIMAIVVLNAAIGFSQDYHAEKAIAALKRLAVPFVKVRRGGTLRTVPAAELVPGDIILLEAGSLVAADCRVLESANLQTLEASLTGESEPIGKTSAALTHPQLPLGDRRNMVFLGTIVAAGRGVGVVTETGMRTELGHVATMVQSVQREPTVLQRRLDHLGKILSIAALLLVAVIFALGVIRGENLKLMLLAAVSLGVAAVPEGLPAVVTIALALGAQRMLKRKTLIRKLPAVETLGSVTVICSDKTGTLTSNQMTAQILLLPDAQLDLSAASGRNEPANLPSRTSPAPEFSRLLIGAALCNDATLAAKTELNASPELLGDPTETALVAAAAGFELHKEQLERILPRVAEYPFASERKRMSTVHQLPRETSHLPGYGPLFDRGSSSYAVFAKGAVDSLLDISDNVLVNGRREPLDKNWRVRLEAANDGLASKGMRVLGVAFRGLDAIPAEEELYSIEQALTFVGMIGMVDPPRPEAAQAVSLCKMAGIRPVMITGDHPLTAKYIAEELGIASGSVLTGPQFERISAADLDSVVENTSVYARVSPEHKLNIVEGLQHRGQIVAMTGDGVNDAPALKKANIGVAMGITGTDVAKEAADIVLLDDNFATIVAAVQEGRVIYDNIRKFVRYILATNTGEIWLMVLAPFFGMPLPLFPLQILWMNLVTDGLPALALGVEPSESETMRRPPYPPGESIFARGLGRHIVWVGLLMGILSLVPGLYYWRLNDPAWRTIVFSTLTLSQMANVLAIRVERRSVFQAGFFANQALIGAVALTVLLQIALIYVPFLQIFFRTTALSVRDLALVFAVSSIIFFAVEAEKWITRVLRRRAAG
jgi:P-type Ca2+ transporter type 2C